jgi:hypothetical protein
MTAEHAAGVGGEVEVSVAIKAQNPNLDAAWRTIAWWEQTAEHWRNEALKGYALRDSLSAREAADRAATRQAAADAVLAEARAMCCDADTSAHHEATDGHARVMAIAERLAAAVRGAK